MRAVQKRRVAWYCLPVLSLVPIAAASAGGGALSIEWSSIDAGGGVSSGGGFVLAGSLGQHDAGPMSASGFEVAGGFWPGAAPTSTPAPCPGDLNGDLSVDSQDLNVLLGAFASSGAGDLDDDGDTDSSDLNILLGAFGSNCP